MFYFDEELQEWVDDESGEVEAPLPPREELKYRNEPPSPPGFGLGGKYVMGKLPNDYVPEERPGDSLSMPSMLTPKDYGDPMAGSGPYDPETSAMITGYGKNLMLKKAGKEQPWLLPGGDMAPPGYVQDVEKTMGELDRGEMSETQLGEKIKRNEGMPPGRKPTEGEVNIVDFVNFHMSDVEPKLREQAKEARKAWEKTVSHSTRALNEARFDSQGAEIEQRTYNELRNEEKSLATKHAERLQKAEDAKRNPRSQTEEQLVATFLHDPSPERRAKAKAVLDVMQENKRKIAEASRNLPQQTQFTDPATGQPLIFDKATGAYKVAPVEGGGGIAPRPVNPSAGEREKTASFGAIQEQMKKIQSTYEANKDYVGVVSGQVGRVSQLWDSGEAGFRRDIADMKDTLMRARSGAQINEKEYARLSALVPSPGDSDTMFEGKMKAFNDYLAVTIRHRSEAQQKGGVKIGGGQGSGKPTPTRAELEAEARRRGLIK